ncbi:hypothetical protein [Desulfotomaculum nigrificans]|uniref:hypothetical protein n=1 Tax=Desulfotomaculum nigrificans TaxID=1565 RepID=UPI0001FAEC4C|nr:hypothetical protein [Desulfotomaculum nigrificans]
MKRVVSVSLGSSRRDYTGQFDLLGQRILVQRIGTDGSMARAVDLLKKLDGQVDVLTLGGVNLYLRVGKYKFPLRDGVKLAGHVKYTPLVDGSGIKEAVETNLVNFLQVRYGWPRAGQRVLISSVLDRFPLAAALQRVGCRLIIGDAMFALGLPIAFSSLSWFTGLAGITVPVLARLPISWLYPLGDRQERIKPRFAGWYQKADIIAGDFHFIRRHMPENLAGKIIITSTVTAGDVAELRKRGAAWLVTTSPDLDGRSLGANVLEGICVALLNSFPGAITTADYQKLLDQLGWRPRVEKLSVGS